MKKIILIVMTVMFMTSLIGCGTKEILPEAQAAYFNITPIPVITIEPTVTPIPTAIPTVEPTVTPAPKLTSLEKKYQYYDFNFEDCGEVISNGTPEELESMLDESGFYSTWYSMNDATFNQTLNFDKYIMNNKEYGIKCMIFEDAGTFLIYYFYLDDPDNVLIISSLISETCNNYVLVDGDGNSYSSISADDIESQMALNKELTGTDEYSPLTVEDIYPSAKEYAREKLENELGLTINDMVFGGYSYQPYIEVYFDYDSQGNYYLSFWIQYHKGSYEVNAQAEVEFTDRDFDGVLELKDVDLD